MTPLRPEVIDRLLADTEPWLSCDDCFDQLDLAIDGVLASAAPLPETIRVHLAACPVCHEEARSLATLVAGDHELSADVAATRLEAAVLTRRTRAGRRRG